MLKEEKNILLKKVKGLKGGPFENTKTFFPQDVFNFFSHHSLFSQKYAHNNKERIFYRNVLKLQRFSKVFCNVGGNALFWRNQKYKNLLKP